MKTLQLDIPGYCAAEQDLCRLHAVPEEDQEIEVEIRLLQDRFAKQFPRLTIRKDFEFPDWHHNIRLLWAYLYADEFYTPALIPFVQDCLKSMPRSWFAEFECYSPALESPELPSGFVGEFLVYKDTMIFDDDEQWATYLPKLGL
jgi:hypothetical protein